MEITKDDTGKNFCCYADKTGLTLLGCKIKKVTDKSVVSKFGRVVKKSDVFFIGTDKEYRVFCLKVREVRKKSEQVMRDWLKEEIKKLVEQC